MPTSTDVIYYDDEMGVGINAYFDFGHEYFSSFNQFRSWCESEYGSFELVLITDENYPVLCAQGVFDNV